ncbi:MAG: alpha,alpha-trehalase TreF [Gluconacetobacter diazotrophicus]|nr:alpha,alpha-trehalase TreF [Gluconacetobacter diazotrophicus]
MASACRRIGAVAALGVLLAAAAPLPPPSVLWGPLYPAVELNAVFADQKSFADAVPRAAPDTVLAEYAREKDRPGFALRAFVADHFTTPAPKRPVQPEPGRDVRTYIHAMWDVLQRAPDQAPEWSSLLPLPFPYVVPGGRFIEIYYWDSYFTMMGLEQDGRAALARDMLRNMASLIDRYGHVPNGNRTYYLSRSEPPFFPLMVELVAERDGDGVLREFLPQMRREWEYWTEGTDALPPGRQHRHAVRLADGTVLNRYWDDRDAPRDESYREDVETAASSGRPKEQVFRDLRAGGESGWDFSSRWLGDGHDLATIRTTRILPVDLNALLAHMERVLSRTYALNGDRGQADAFAARADQRVAAMRRLMWDADTGAFRDWDWEKGARTPALTAATVVPLFLGEATPAEARAVARTVREQLLRPGGMTTSLERNGQQWDGPNGWAPMQWMAVQGFRRYGEGELAREIARRWVAREMSAYRRSGVLLEKYDVHTAQVPASGGGGGGEYPLQVGFGWTNGVLAKLLAEYPDLAREAGTDATDR